MLYTVQIYIPTKKDLVSEWSKGLLYLEKKLLYLESFLFATQGRWFWQVLYSLTGRCGSQRFGHTPIYGNSHQWLWKHTETNNRVTSRCVICGDSHVTTRLTNNSARYASIANKGREKDMEQLNCSYATATNEAEKTAVLHAISKLNNERGDSLKSSLREAIVKATRENDTQRLKEIHENLGDSRKWQND